MNPLNISFITYLEIFSIALLTIFFSIIIFNLLFKISSYDTSFMESFTILLDYFLHMLYNISSAIISIGSIITLLALLLSTLLTSYFNI